MKMLDHSKEDLQQKKKQSRKRRTLTWTAAALSVFLTLNFLILPAATLSKDDKAVEQKEGISYEMPSESPEAENAPKEEQVSAEKTEEKADIKEEAQAKTAETKEEKETETQIKETKEEESKAETKEETKEEDPKAQAQETKEEKETEMAPAGKALVNVKKADGTDSDLKLTVEYGDDTLPRGADFHAVMLDPDVSSYEAYEEKALAAVEEESKEVLALFDVTITDDKGIVIEPENPVSVKLDPGEELSDECSYYAVHFPDTRYQGGSLAGHSLKKAAGAGKAKSPGQPIPAEQKDGQLTFTAKSFSVYGIVATKGTEHVSASEGDTVTVTGTDAKYHQWSLTCDPEGCAAITDTESKDVKLIAAAAGSVTLTHRYGSKKNKLNSTETFTVTITEKSDVSEEDSEAKPAKDDGMTVSVKDTGRLKKLSDYHVVVEEANADYEGEANLLQAYHIYLADSSGQEVLADDLQVKGNSLNLKVMITYDKFPDWFAKAKSIKHYKNKSDRTEQFITGVKFDSNVRTISFTVHVFSDFTIMSDGSGSGTGGGTAAAEQGSILNSSVSLDPNAANSWQVVDQGYEGNGPDNKTNYGNDSYQAVRVQKNVIPTGTENEFYVYLSVDTKLLMSEYLQYAQYQATTSNNYHDRDLGTVVEAMTGNQKVGVSGDSSSGYPNSANFTIQDSSGNVIAENVSLYWSQANNVTFYLKTSSGKYILMGITVRKNSSNTVRLSSEAEKYIYEDIMKLISLDRVTDTMGDYIEYLGPVAGDYSSEPSFDSSTGTLTWTPVMKENPQEQTTKSGSTITTWSLNVAELVYKVRLKVQDDGFNSCASNMQSKVVDKESYEVNKSAALSYQTKKGNNTGIGTAQFQKPYVRGLLYDYQIKKTDEKGNALLGAQFSLEGSGNNRTVTYKLTGESGNDGMVSWKHAADSFKPKGTEASSPGTAWGTYTVKETKAPDGYKMSDEWKNGKTVTLCYTTDPESLQVNGTHMALKGGNASYVTVMNTKIPETPVRIIKLDMTDKGKHLSGAVFDTEKTAPEGESGQTYTWTSDQDGQVYSGSLPYGTYTMTETTAPEGYNKLSGTVKVTVGDGSVTYSQTDSQGGKPQTAALLDPSKEASADNPYVVYIYNNPGVELPETGGPGRLSYTLSGIALLAAAALMYSFRMRRGERRIK